MAKQINFTNAQGVTFALSYWRVTKVVFDIVNKSINITAIGHRDNQARLDGLEIVGRKSINVTDPDDFDTLAALIISKRRNPLEIGYFILNRETFFNLGEDV